MTIPILDIAVFFGFIISVIAIGIYMSKKEGGSSESYFLAGRGLGWILIGFSLIAANISTEQFVGMSGDAARPVGLAIAGYEWLAAVTLVVVAFFFLPKFLTAGVYTIPEFLEKRYGPSSRLLMSIAMTIMLIGVNITGVIFSGAKTLEIFVGESLNLTSACWIVGVVSAIYVMLGGLKACAWADLIQGSALIVGGAIILVLALAALDKADVNKIAPNAEIAQQMEGQTSIEKFKTLNSERLHTIRPADDPKVPWTALIIGLWIPNFYYWGLNQYIMQRTLGAKSLAHGQGGIVFAAGMKLLIPFIVVFPGMMALNLFKDDSLGYATNMKSEAHYKTNQFTVAVFEKTSGLDLPSFDISGMENTASERRFIAEATRLASEVQAGDRHIAFKFNADFAALYPEDAAKIVEFNSRFGEATGATLIEQNNSLLSHVDKSNAAIVGSGFQRMGNSIVTMFKGDPPGVIAVQKEMIGYDQDAAFPLLLRNLLTSGIGLQGFVLAALMGAVMSSLASMLNAASTIVTMDMFKEYIAPKASEKSLVFTGRVLVAIFVVIGCVVAPMLGHPRFGGIFSYIQEFQGFISPGILAIFLFGMFVSRAPSACGIVGLLGSPILYGLLMFFAPHVAFLDRMAITFAIIYALLLQITVAFPRKVPFVFEKATDMELKSSPIAKFCGILIVISVGLLYWYFR